MDGQKVVDMINNKISPKHDKTCSFSFSIKNHIGGLARVLKIFQVKSSK
mgnify:FL=1